MREQLNKWRRLVATLLVLGCLVAGCSYDRAEPGLFRQPMTRQTTAPPIRPVTPAETLPSPNPDLPVVGEAIWTSADGLDITMRLAVHAVRRVEGGTVLDWSVTPLHGAGLRPSDPLPTTVDLGLSRHGEGYPDILLVDAARARVYRPLTRKGWGSLCLCTPVTVAQRSLRIDYTTLLQVAFPALPDDLETVDVQLATAPPFWRVPVTPHGMRPLASYPTDLTRPAERTPVLASTQPFTYRPAGQRYLVMVNAVYTSSSFTSVAWTILSIEAGHGLGAASTPPFADAEPPRRAYNQISAGGPQIKVGTGRPVWRARLVTTRLAGLGALECLCTDLRSGAAALRRTGQQMRVITNLPPVPSGTASVDIVFPGLTTFTDVAVTPAPNSAFRSAGPAVRGVGFWTYREDKPHPGWRPQGLADPAAAGRSVTGLPSHGRRDCPLSNSCRGRKLADQPLSGQIRGLSLSKPEKLPFDKHRPESVEGLRAQQGSRFAPLQAAARLRHMTDARLPDPVMVVLAGAAGSGKSTWAC